MQGMGEASVVLSSRTTWVGASLHSHTAHVCEWLWALRRRKECKHQVLTALSPNIPLPAFPSNSGFGKFPSCGSKVNQTTSPESVRQPGPVLWPLWSWFLEGNDPPKRRWNFQGLPSGPVVETNMVSEMWEFPFYASHLASYLWREKEPCSLWEGVQSIPGWGKGTLDYFIVYAKWADASRIAQDS